MAEIEQIYARLGDLLAPEQEKILWSNCVHEAAGHGFVAAQFNLEPEELVVSADTGVCVHRRGSSLANAAVGFGGVMAEALLNVPHKSPALPKIPLTQSTLYRWVDELKLNLLSTEDREAIQSHPNRYEAAGAAFDILHSSLPALEHVARSLAERSREKFAQAARRPSFQNEAEIRRFIWEQNEAHAEKAMEKKLREAAVQAEQILANLPPCAVPAEYNLETFRMATDATDSEIRAFCEFKVRRERNQIGLGAPNDLAIQAAVKFFQESGIQTRDSWIFQTKAFCTWRDKQPSKEIK